MKLKKNQENKLYEEEVKKQRSIRQSLSREAGQFKKEFADRLFKLVTSGFGLVAALAWNEFIKEAVNIYVKPYFGQGSGLVSLFVYAILVTVLAVMVTYNLSKFGGKESKD